MHITFWHVWSNKPVSLYNGEGVGWGVYSSEHIDLNLLQDDRIDVVMVNGDDQRVTGNVGSDTEMTPTA